MKKIAAVISISLGLLVLVQLAHAQIYKWVDETGGIHFTQDPTTIPEKYQEKAQSSWRQVVDITGKVLE